MLAPEMRHELVFRRRSVRKYTGEPVDAATLETITAFCAAARPLYPDIKIHSRIVSKEQVRFYFPWKTPQLIAVFSEDKPGYLENVGFVFQQVDLFLQSMGLGSCWLGLGKLRDVGIQEDGMEFVILIAFGHPEESPLRSDISQFQRKPLAEITDTPDIRLEPARLAPSSTNSQPWYFVHEGDTIHAYRSEAGLLRHKTLGSMNRIDMGIALAHMYVTNPDTFQFFSTVAPELKGYRYTGSVTL